MCILNISVLKAPLFGSSTVVQEDLCSLKSNDVGRYIDVSDCVVYVQFMDNLLRSVNYNVYNSTELFVEFKSINDDSFMIDDSYRYSLSIRVTDNNNFDESVHGDVTYFYSPLYGFLRLLDEPSMDDDLEYVTASDGGGDGGSIGSSSSCDFVDADSTSFTTSSTSSFY